MNNARSYKHQQSCTCGQRIYFDNTACLRCGAALVFDPEAGKLITLAADAAQQRCINFESAAQCNWQACLHSDLCLSCSLNLTIPDISLPENASFWRDCEQAKRRLIAQLKALGLPLQSLADNPAQGLGFELLRWQPGDPPLSTSHQGGIITIDIAEADPAWREQMRLRLHEPYRTLLGHFRHESGHYYWQRLVQHSHWLPLFRAVFGDERQDYASALHQHYEHGAPADWQTNYISSYASSHPWEDWAETWAHYLHMSDTLAAAEQMGLHVEAPRLQGDPFTLDDLRDCPFHDPVGAEAFLAMANRWIHLSSTLNVLARSMGQMDIYPFVLSAGSLKKMYLVAGVVGLG